MFLRSIRMYQRRELYFMPLDIKALCQYRLDRAKEDFFIASKADSEIQLNHAHDFVSVVEAYLDNKLNN